MSSDRLEISIEHLVSATESNLRRITTINRDFVAPSLNEWRYATRHIVNLLSDPGNEIENDKVVHHLERAYYDSSDILLTVILDSFRSFDSCYGEYIEDIRAFVPDYCDWTSDLIKAKRLLSESSKDKKFEVAKMFDETSSNLIERLEVLKSQESNIRSKIRKTRRKEIREIFVFLFTGIGAILGILAFICH